MDTKIKFQNLDWTTHKIIKRFKKNPNSSISALFRNLRESHSLSLFADAPIISHIINTLASVGIYPERRKVAYALRQSVELKGKKSFFDSILRRNTFQLQKENGFGSKKGSKTIGCSSITVRAKKEAENANS